MGRYTRNVSTFIEKKKHQNIEGGSIIERDWTTIGERHVIEPGKRRVHSDSGFLFTESNIPGVKKRNRTDNWSEFYTIDSLSPTINNEVNIIKLPDGDSLTSYSYYGSSNEMVRASIENIVKWFPGKCWSDNKYIKRSIGDGMYYLLFDIINDGHHNYVLEFNPENKQRSTYEPLIYEINNPFQIDFFRFGRTFTKDENSLRNIPYSWENYYIKGCKILSYTSWVKPYNECEEDYNVIYEAVVTYEVSPSVSRLNEFYADYGVGIESDDCIEFTSSSVTYNMGHIYGLKLGDNIILCTDIKDFTIVPKPVVITNYFNNLDGFEKLLLTKKSNPIYSPVLKTPVSRGENSYGYYIVNREYTFPSNGYCIVCDGIKYDEYINSLNHLSELTDELFSDNIWRNMTHEAIKNFDWTYQKDYEEGDDIENIFGGTRIKNILRIYGRFFDDIKRYIDNIKLKNCIKIDGVDNLPVAELSDKALLSGWEVYSTKLDNTSNILLTNSYIDSEISKKQSRWLFNDVNEDSPYYSQDEQPKWFKGISGDTFSENDNDNHFMKMLNIQSSHIFRRKGTKHSIEMVLSLFGLGNEEFEIEESYYTVEPIKSDLLYYVYELSEFVFDKNKYVNVNINNDYSTLKSYISSLENGVNSESEPFITINGKYYELKTYTFKELCYNINNKKKFNKLYEDDIFSGVPLKEITIKDEKYIIPYFSQDKIYDGNVQFQTNGGWGKFIEYDIHSEINVKYNYSETLPYITTVQNCEELLYINPYEVQGKTLFYVIDVSDITKFTENESKETVGHYFKLIDSLNPQLTRSWRSIPNVLTDNSFQYNDFCNELDEYGEPKRYLHYGITYEDYILSQYYESIIQDNLGNNPHTGKGNYDLGNQYVTYLQQPFYYSWTHYGFDTEDIDYMSELIKFQINEHNGDKIVINNDLTQNYYLPNKLLVIKNLKYSGPYYNYFKNLIIKYLTQVIPSTTILIFN